MAFGSVSLLPPYHAQNVRGLGGRARRARESVNARSLNVSRCSNFKARPETTRQTHAYQSGYQPGASHHSSVYFRPHVRSTNVPTHFPHPPLFRIGLTGYFVRCNISRTKMRSNHFKTHLRRKKHRLIGTTLRRLETSSDG